jgi:flavin reductase (DIM6/NTAB) family NADH-FMN oxidoreductase RutF
MSAPPGIEPVSFKRAMAQFATGITVVTTRTAAGRPLGLTVNSFCSVSLEPALVLVCIEHRSEAHAGFRESRVFAVSVLNEEQESWSRRFAQGGPSKFDGVAFATGREGLLLVPDALAHLECRVVAAPEGGDHTVYVGEVLALDVRPGRPLLYHGSRYRRMAADNVE